MKLEQAFYRLPLRFDHEALAREVAQFSEAEWRAHPEGHAGNSALPLVSTDGDPGNDDTLGPMRPTPLLERCPYLRQVLAALRTPIGRTRLMRIAGQAEATPHIDSNYYWAQRARVHVPIVTFPSVRFECGSSAVHMAAGECWIFDTWRPHNVINPEPAARIHLVADTAGSEAFWSMLARAQDAPRLVAFDATQSSPFETEEQTFSRVMPPREAQQLLEIVEQELPPSARNPRSATFGAASAGFLRRWHELWQKFGESSAGFADYRAELERFKGELAPLAGHLPLPNKIDAVRAIEHWILQAALNPQVPPRAALAASTGSRFERPVFIVSAPRSGSTLLFEQLSRSMGAFTIGGESHAIIEGIPALTPAECDFDSNRLTAADATPEVVAALQVAFASAVRDRDGNPPPPGAAFRLLEKTPKNALRIPFLAAAFPGARFIYLYREPRESLASIIEAWSSGRFVTYGDLPGWQGPPWSLVLTPGWRALTGKPPAEIAAAQWRVTNEQIMDDLAALGRERWTTVTYADLIADPQRELERLAAFAELGWDKPVHGPMPLSRYTLTRPTPDKWRKHEAAIEPLIPGLTPTVERAHRVCGVAPGPPAVEQPLRSVHTASFTELLRTLKSSLLVSTYQAGKLVVLRANGNVLNTHFRAFQKPMGLALEGQRLAIGTDFDVREYRNVSAAAATLKEPTAHDACFLPRSTHVTGDIQIHDIAYASGELWCVNTTFSCLCTLHVDFSFVPRWRPSFVSALAAEDRCHLNGLCVVDGRPRFVTALAETDGPRAWRDHKKDGGIVIDVAENRVIARGLSMPHSPRWHQGRLWVLNSGAGGLGTIDLESGRYQEVARLPGFTRGLDFAGKYAFVGLSQVRESAVFSGIAIAQLPLEQRRSGVWVVDTESGKTVAFVEFQGQVQEIFSVLLLPGASFPDIADDTALIRRTFVLPDEALRDVKV